jgi:hypothetical protein
MGVRDRHFEQGHMNTNTDRERAFERAQARRDALMLTLTGPLVTAVLLVVWAVTGAGYFWPHVDRPRRRALARVRPDRSGGRGRRAPPTGQIAAA